jgi:hypothetical protein
MKKLLLTTAFILAGTASVQAATTTTDTETTNTTTVKHTTTHHGYARKHYHTGNTTNNYYQQETNNYYVVADRPRVEVVERRPYYREAHPAYYSSFGGGKNNPAEYDWNYWDFDRQTRVVYRPDYVAPAYTSYNWRWEPVTVQQTAMADNPNVVQDNRFGENPHWGWSRTHRFDRIRMHG